MDSEAAGTVATDVELADAAPCAERKRPRDGGNTQDALPRANLPLSMLTPKNGKLGAREVCIAWPFLHKGKWKDPQGVEQTFTRFECVLVSLRDPTQYCLGEVKFARHQTLTPELAEKVKG